MSPQAGDWGFAQRPRQPTEDLGALWQRAQVAIENAPACPCHGVVPGRVDPDAIEENLLAALRTRYRMTGQSELVTLIDARLRKSPFAGLRQSFGHWLNDLDTAILDATARETLSRDIAAVLTYYASAESQFICTV